jgi:hypothetical protein
MKSSFKLFAFLIITTLLVTLTLGVASSAGTPVVTPGTNPAAINLGAVRYREFKTGPNEEAYLEVPDLDTGGSHRTQIDLAWGVLTRSRLLMILYPINS